MKSETPSMQTLLQNFFLQRLMQQRKVSVETTHSYRDTFRIYLQYIQDIYHISPVNVKIEHFDLAYLQDFCKYLESKRNNKPVTINNRIAAIKSFIHYVSEMEPEYSAITKRALMLPAQKQEQSTMDFLTKEEFDSMVAVCDTNTFIRARDKLMLMLLYNSGARVSELLKIRLTDIQKADAINHANLKIYGKGRKQRIIPLWKSTVTYINKYTKDYPIGNEGELFMNKNGDKLTRSGVRTRINSIVAHAVEHTPSLFEKNVTPHTFRHSVAMNLLASGVDISTIAIWLGHASIETTHKNMVADMEMKRKAMEKAGTAGNDSYKYKPSTDLLRFLNSL